MTQAVSNASMATNAASSLRSASHQLGLSLTDGQVGQLSDYLELLAKWNRTYNLTSLRTLDDMVSHHVVDCLAVVAPLRRHRGLHGIGRLLDVGSGGGLPGLIIAIAEPAASVTCVESVGKKAAFIQHAAASLGLRNVSAKHARVETLRGDPFDVVTSRAFASLRDFTAATAELLNDGGVWVAMKGKRPDAEIAELPVGVEMFHVEQISSMPVSLGKRCLVWMRPSHSAKAFNSEYTLT